MQLHWKCSNAILFISTQKKTLEGRKYGKESKTEICSSTKWMMTIKGLKINSTQENEPSAMQRYKVNEMKTEKHKKKVVVNVPDSLLTI